MKKILFLIAVLAGVCFAASDDTNEKMQRLRQYERLCYEKGTALACHFAARFYDNAEFYYGIKGVKSDYKKAAELYKIGCDDNEPGSCSALGMLYFKGNGVKQSHKSAFELFKKSCKNIGATGCFYLAHAYKEGIGTRQDFKLAKEYFGKACDWGLQEGCDGYRQMNESGY